MALDGGLSVNNPLRSPELTGRPTEAQREGALGGYKVTTSSTQESRLADAAEELTFGVDNTEELELKERHEKDSAGSSLVERVKLHQELMHQAGHEDRLAQLASRLLKAANREAALALVKELFPEPADAYAALAAVEEGLTGEPKKFARQAMEELDRAAGPEIRAGLAGAAAGREFGDLGTPLELKKDYVQAVVDFSGPMDMLDNIYKRFGADGFERGVDFLLKALADDLAAERPSRETASLEAVGAQLGHVRLLNSVRAQGEKLADRWRLAHGEADSKLTGKDFLQFVVSAAKETFISSSLAEPLVKLAAPPDIEKEVLFRQDLFNAARGVVPRAFGDLDVRNRCLAALQDGLDQAVAREDAWLAEGLEQFS
ncbi:MAG: type III secretion system gatekeeper subunit SctW [Deltaproteobacteria bacterium]|jgi:type III secretion protein W|nr:type III secretion system gatekeeper subunit SctW [Deltaproteobacteria bacterium]